MADQTRIDALLARLGSDLDMELDALRELKSHLGDQLPQALLSHYRVSKSWKARLSCVFHSIRYARKSDAAVELALLGLWDRSKRVRYRSCMLLACSLRRSTLDELKRVASEAKDIETKEHAFAAIDAIASSNHHYFVDRDHSGQVFYTFDDELAD